MSFHFLFFSFLFLLVGYRFSSVGYKWHSDGGSDGGRWQYISHKIPYHNFKYYGIYDARNVIIKFTLCLRHVSRNTPHLLVLSCHYTHLKESSSILLPHRRTSTTPLPY